MAIGKASDFKIYQEEYFGGMYESIVQNTNAFNGASQGAITLVAREHRGDYLKESFMKDISALISRRDTTSVAAATDTALTQGENVSVKIARKIGPIAQTLDAWRKISRDPREMSFLIGAMVGQKKVQDYLNTALKAAVPAIKAVTANLHDYSATGTPTHNVMVTGLSKMGDQAARVKVWVMHSKSYFDLVGQALTDKIVNVADIVIYNGTVATLGRPTIVTDAAALLTTGTPNKYSILGLVDNAITVSESETEEIESQIITGLENLVFRIQGEHSFTLGIKGFTWDVTNGGANPDDTAVATATNWDKVASADKDIAGVAIYVQ
jgi:PKD repeat protein